MMNIMPLIPQGKFKGVKEPNVLEINTAKMTAGKHMNQLNSCGRCRADAVGLIK